MLNQAIMAAIFDNVSFNTEPRHVTGYTERVLLSLFVGFLKASLVRSLGLWRNNNIKYPYPCFIADYNISTRSGTLPVCYMTYYITLLRTSTANVMLLFLAQCFFFKRVSVLLWFFKSISFTVFGILQGIHI